MTPSCRRTVPHAMPTRTVLDAAGRGAARGGPEPHRGPPLRDPAGGAGGLRARRPLPVRVHGRPRCGELTPAPRPRPRARPPRLECPRTRSRDRYFPVAFEGVARHAVRQPSADVSGSGACEGRRPACTSGWSGCPPPEPSGFCAQPARGWLPTETVPERRIRRRRTRALMFSMLPFSAVLTGGRLRESHHVEAFLHFTGGGPPVQRKSGP